MTLCNVLSTIRETKRSWNAVKFKKNKTGIIIIIIKETPYLSLIIRYKNLKSHVFNPKPRARSGITHYSSANTKVS